MSYQYFTFKSPNNRQSAVTKQSGFGLIELMVSVGIMALISAIVFVKQDSFNGAVLLRNQTYNIALDIRNTQLNAVSVVGDSGDYYEGFGVYFDTTTGFEQEYTAFNDINKNGFYDSGEKLPYITGLLDQRFEIRDLRLGGASVDTVSIIFKRPNFDAVFYTAPNTPSNSSDLEIDIARRGVTGSGPEVLRTIEVIATGQVAVK